MRKFTYNGKTYKFSKITKDMGAWILCPKTKLLNPIDFKEFKVAGVRYIIIHAMYCYVWKK